MRGQDLLQKPAGRAEKFLVQSPELERAVPGGVGGVFHQVVFLGHVKEGDAVGESLLQSRHAFDPVGPTERIADEPGRSRAGLGHQRQRTSLGHQVRHRRRKPRNLAGQMIFANQHVAGICDSLIQQGGGVATKPVAANLKIGAYFPQLLLEGRNGRG